MSHHDEQIQAELQHEITKTQLAQEGERRAKEDLEDAFEMVGLLLMSITVRGTIRKDSKAHVAHVATWYEKAQTRWRD